MTLYTSLSSAFSPSVSQSNDWDNYTRAQRGYYLSLNRCLLTICIFSFLSLLSHNENKFNARNAYKSLIVASSHKRWFNDNTPVWVSVSVTVSVSEWWPLTPAIPNEQVYWCSFMSSYSRLIVSCTVCARLTWKYALFTKIVLFVFLLHFTAFNGNVHTLICVRTVHIKWLQSNDSSQLSYLRNECCCSCRLPLVIFLNCWRFQWSPPFDPCMWLLLFYWRIIDEDYRRCITQCG